MISLDSIREMQAAHKHWLDHNFPEQTSYHGLLGIAEEVGELSHAHLKGEQGIRHTASEIHEMKKDALGDIFIFMLSYANSNDFDVAECIESTWENIVARRDWIENPSSGVVA
jgi:NTP pyrophosphatase (non-canonical NTP hydrolase)